MPAEQLELTWRSVETPIGALTLLASSEGLTHVLFADQRSGDVGAVDARPDRGHTLLAEAAEQLVEYFGHRRRRFELALDLRGTDFQRTAWTALADIPYGATVTYAEQAAAIGRPTAVRAVGAANGRNPVPIVLPCHRVVGSDGALTGFAGGIHTKRWLLDHEHPGQLRFDEH